MIFVFNSEKEFLVRQIINFLFILLIFNLSYANDQYGRVGLLVCSTEDMLNIPMSFDEFQKRSSGNFGWRQSTTAPNYRAPFILGHYYTMEEILSVVEHAKKLSCELKFGLNKSIMDGNEPTDISCEFINLANDNRKLIYSTISTDYSDCAIQYMM